MKIGIVGCTGRMGKALIEEIYLNGNCKLSAGAVRPESDFVGMDIGTLAGIDAVGINACGTLEGLFENSDAVIDFSKPSVALRCAKIASEQGKILVSGTTGFSDYELTKLKEHSKNAAIIWSGNMSMGINILSSVIEQVASILDESFDIEVIEMHHCHKVDAPSGTALLLGEAAARGRKVALDDVACKSRDGIIGSRKRGEIGFSTIRGGDVVGEHTVMFAGDGERIEFTHKASSRKIFAKGAVKAALWAKNRQQGFYSMKDVLMGK
ncbi:MAG: 4-hydroxy-tetrahydrodipicolinate reductase [Alphaproteobacteria bacterium CG11_big_fil_rev_8_21_14_0_20_39_49]|nr:MAG: 4-hydroxy-tetrahydrodipicolinate reductase [Alphaproteobacteria bacterium CG11_big_fil_rev_8_21_14_0_20_39_49]